MAPTTRSKGKAKARGKSIATDATSDDNEDDAIAKRTRHALSRHHSTDTPTVNADSDDDDYEATTSKRRNKGKDVVSQPQPTNDDSVASHTRSRGTIVRYDRTESEDVETDAEDDCPGEPGGRRRRVKRVRFVDKPHVVEFETSYDDGDVNMEAESGRVTRSGALLRPSGEGGDEGQDEEDADEAEWEEEEEGREQEEQQEQGYDEQPGGEEDEEDCNDDEQEEEDDSQATSASAKKRAKQTTKAKPSKNPPRAPHLPCTRCKRHKLACKPSAASGSTKRCARCEARGVGHCSWGDDVVKHKSSTR